jgi:hypothetical protein
VPGSRRGGTHLAPVLGMVYRNPAVRTIESPRPSRAADGPRGLRSPAPSPALIPEAEILTLDPWNGRGVLHRPAPERFGVPSLPLPAPAREAARN